MERDWRKTEKGFFNEFEKEIEHMNDLIKGMMQSFGEEPQIYGFSMQVTPDGIPHIERFGNVIPVGKNRDVREPYTCSLVDEKNNELKITAEMPGINKEDIELHATENEVFIKADSNGRKYFKSITPQCQIDEDSASAKYNNGVLEVTFKCKDITKKNGKSIKIE